MDRPASLSVVGHSLHALTMDQAVDLCIGWCHASGAGSARVVMPINAQIVVTMRSDGALRDAADAADLRVADGASILWAARLTGDRFPERVTGIDLMQRLLERAAAENLSVFFLGARPLVLERLVDICRQRYPTLRIAGFADGYFAPHSHEAMIARIQASGADLLFIGMPSPFKEVWAEKNRARLGVRLILGVGGSFDVLAGVIPRAPAMLQDWGLEWLWRLLCEPRRMWKRYLVGNTTFIAIALGFALRQRRHAPERASAVIGNSET